MTVSLGNIAPEDWAAVERMRQRLQSLVVDTGGQSVGIRFAQATLSFAASTNSGTITVSHGLGRTPIVVVATAHNAPAFGNVPTCHAATFTSTTFQMNGEVKTAFTGDVAVSWVAIG